MPIPFLEHVLFNGLPSWAPEPHRLLAIGGSLGAIAVTKRYCTGATNRAERNMHGRVVMITGGTSGIGAVAAVELARRGAQIILLTRQPPNDPFLVEHIDDLRVQTGNEMIYAEQVDLSSLYSIRQFATKWIDNAPPRRLDMIILCGATLTPPGKEREETREGLEQTWMVNYLANFHLLGILSPAIKAQPFDRDVRIILPTCSSYIGSPSLSDALDTETWTPGTAYQRSKLALMIFGRSFQKHLDAYKRPDGLPMTTRVIFADPGYSRTASMTRWLTRGSLWGLLLYVVFYALPWLFLKSSVMGAQSILYAAMEGNLSRDGGGRLIKECMEVDFARKDIENEEISKELWESSDKLIERTEKAEAQKRAKEKRENEKREQKQQEEERVKEIESLVTTIKQGKKKEAKKAKSRKNPNKFGQKAID